MKTSTIITLVAVLNLLFLQPSKAEVRLPAIVSSNMVLQRNTTIVLWGWADAKEKVSIEASWLEEPLELKADKDGNWRVEVATTNSKASQTITIHSATSEIILDNVLFGEVWLCSGQSNMELPLKGYTGQPVFDANRVIATSRNSNLRLFTVKKVASKTPLQDLEKFNAWEAASPDNVASFSAVAYHYGQQLQTILDCPVGMINASWGGSMIQTWMSREVLGAYQEINLEKVNMKKMPHHIPTLLFNAMINPLIPYTIKGALWYQGESNRNEPAYYEKIFPAMVKDWRTRWGIGDFPFYYVQIAPYYYNHEEAFQSVENTAFLREAQLKCLDSIPNAGMAVTMDIGEEMCIHPANKKEVADRLLYNALHQTYGFKTVDGASPRYASLKVKDAGINLSFIDAESGLYAYDGLSGFEIAGDDKVFYPAKAKILNRRSVYVKSEDVPHPVAVRYAWRNWVVGTLYDTNLLPASSFRTDDWDDATQVGK